MSPNGREPGRAQALRTVYRAADAAAGQAALDTFAQGPWGRKISGNRPALAPQSTGVYWIPAYEILEQHGFEVLLVNARYAKNVPGRKTDVSDAAWLRQLHSYGLLRGSFRPDAEIATVRAYLRHRERITSISSR